MSDYIEIEEFENNFAQVPKTALKDPKLSLKAKGLYAYLFSLPKAWKVYRTELVKHVSDGKDSMNSAFKELETYGYIQSTSVRDAGKFKGYRLKLLINPQKQPLRENRSGITGTGLTVDGKPATNNKDLKNTDSIDNSLFSNKEAPSCLDNFIIEFNKIRGGQFTLTDKVKSQLKQRLKSYSCGQILVALTNSMKNKIHIENNFNSITPAFITRADVIEMYLNFKAVDIPSIGSIYPLVYSRKFEMSLPTDEVSKYWRHLRETGYTPKKDNQQKVVDWIKAR